FGDVAPDTTFALAGGSPFPVEGSPIARDALVAEAGLDFSVTKTVTLGVSYTGQMSSAVPAPGGRGDLSWRF
ncbi:autotransporter domain-containing protein, partial [Staphylococcus aureus]